MAQSNALPEHSLSQKTREYKLYVDNLPQELNEHGIKEIFNHYGEAALFYRCNATWAYISYDTYQEAESALNDLNGTPPLHLKVSFAKEKDTSNAYSKHLYDSGNLKEYNDNSIQDFIHSDRSHTSVAGRGKPLNSIRPSPQLSVHECTRGDDLLHPLPVDSYMYYPYENAGFFNSTNTLWGKGTVTVRQDGKRHVSFGRGYTLYEIPNPHPKIEDNINKIYEKRITGLYEYGEDSLKSKVGKCQHCLKITKMTCGRCHIFYCSTTCQKTDWQRHKVECQTIPALVKAVDSTSLSRSSSEEQILARDLYSAPRTLRKPKKFVEMHKTENTNPTMSDINDDKNKTDCRNPQFTYTIDNKTNISTEELSEVIPNSTNKTKTSQLKTLKQDYTQVETSKCNPLKSYNKKHCKTEFIKDSGNNAQKINGRNNTTESQLSNEETQSENMVPNAVLEVEKDLAFQKDTFLPKDKFVDVKIILADGNNEYWIHKVEQTNELMSLMTNLQYIANAGEDLPKEKLINGNIYGVQYDEIWHRATLLSTCPVKVHYIDFGNEEKLDVYTFRDIGIMNVTPRFSRKIRLLQNIQYKDLDVDSVLSVMMISVDPQGVISVRVRGHDGIEIGSEESSNIVNNIEEVSEERGINISTNTPCAELKSGSEVLLTTYRNQYLLFARSCERDEVERYNDIMQRIAKCAQTAPELRGLPDIGQMVIAPFKDGNYYRGVVRKIQSDNVWIIYVDFGNAEMISLNKLRMLPDDLKEIRACTAKIVLKDVPQDVVITKEVSDYLDCVVRREMPLVCTFDGIPSKDGVYLKTLRGENINNKINDLLKPSWKREDEDDKRCYMLRNITYVSLGNINQIIDAYISCVLIEGHKYILYPSDLRSVTYIRNVMPAIMKKYCESAHYYIPRQEELCLALYQDNWYRAVCCNRQTTPTTAEMLFIDYGYTKNINHKDIRFMPKDFILPEAIGILCIIANLAPTDENGKYGPKVQNRISQLVLPNTKVTIKIVKYLSLGIYKVELPRIREQLIKERLISAN